MAKTDIEIARESKMEPIADIGAKLGGKYDRIELLDLDGDGDLDLLTCDEGNTNSVLWFENPHNLAPGAQPITSPTPSPSSPGQRK